MSTIAWIEPLLLFTAHLRRNRYNEHNGVFDSDPPGKTDDGKRFAKQISGARHKEMDESRRSLGQTRETTWVQSTPMGDMLLVYLEGNDSQRANERFAASMTPFDVWFKAEAKTFTGVDFGQPLPKGFVEIGVESTLGTTHEASLAVAFLVLPGKTDAWRRVAKEVAGERRKDLEAHDKRYNLVREYWYLQHTPQGDVAIAYLEGKDPAAAFKSWAASNEPFDKWEKDQFAVIHGIDFSKPLPGLPEPLFDWQLS